MILPISYSCFVVMFAVCCFVFREGSGRSALRGGGARGEDLNAATESAVPTGSILLSFRDMTTRDGDGRTYDGQTDVGSQRMSGP